MSTSPLAYMHAVALRLMALEASGARWLLYPSWCDESGDTYIVQVWPKDSRASVPVAGRSLLDVLIKAEERLRAAPRAGQGG